MLKKGDAAAAEGSGLRTPGRRGARPGHKPPNEHGFRMVGPGPSAPASNASGARSPRLPPLGCRRCRVPFSAPS